ncbi:hypothetical protein [Chroococcidiopsis sp. SAG 2025]|nr:hypothetical protein [Chroococcidiopsis sp. SAG 2025]
MLHHLDSREQGKNSKFKISRLLYERVLTEDLLPGLSIFPDSWTDGF